MAPHESPTVVHGLCLIMKENILYSSTSNILLLTKDLMLLNDRRTEERGIGIGEQFTRTFDYMVTKH